MGIGYLHPYLGDGIPGAILTDRVDVYVRNYVGVMHLIDDADCRRLRFVDRSHQLHATCALLLIPVFFFPVEIFRPLCSFSLDIVSVSGVFFADR